MCFCLILSCCFQAIYVIVHWCLCASVMDLRMQALSGVIYHAQTQTLSHCFIYNICIDTMLYMYNGVCVAVWIKCGFPPFHLLGSPQPKSWRVIHKWSQLICLLAEVCNLYLIVSCMYCCTYVLMFLERVLVVVLFVCVCVIVLHICIVVSWESPCQVVVCTIEGGAELRTICVASVILSVYVFVIVWCLQGPRPWTSSSYHGCNASATSRGEDQWGQMSCICYSCW